MILPEAPEDGPKVAPEEFARRKHQVWLITGLMVLGFCLAATLLLVVFAFYGEDIRLILATLFNR
ncbi:hypothetical protein FDZ73_24675 [bacterium]|nr:MAG: hypothetical protein FDZ73_24675 [bacterium]